MADENPPTTPDDKGQTVRINLPAAGEEAFEKTTPLGEKTVPIGVTEKTEPLPQANKGQTVRINVPPPADSNIKRETVVISTPPPGTPKKETTHLQAGAPAGSKPVLPPPPISKPMAPGLPKPPLGGLKPAAPAAPAPAAQQRPISPKKETARIQIPPQPKTPLHKATVKLEQPKPASVAPAASIAVAQAPAEPVVVEDSTVGILSWVVVVASLAAVVISYLAFSA
jgi:hypothetical protein